MKEIIKKNWLFLLIVLQPILDIVAYFQYDSKIGTIAGYIRLLLMVIIVFYALYKIPKKRNFLILMGIIGIYCILHIANGFRVGYLSLAEDVSYMAKVLQMPVLGIAFCYLFKNNSHKKQIINAFVVNFFVIIGTTLIAHLTGTGEYTYKIYKVGYMGWFANATSQSIIIVTLVPFVLYWISRKKNIFISFITEILSCLVLIANGTKAAYLSIFIILGGLIFFYLLDYLLVREKCVKKEKSKMLLLSIGFFVLMIGSVIIYPITPRHLVDVSDSGVRDVENQTIEEKKQEISEKLTVEEILADPQEKEKLIECYKPLLNERLVEKFGVEAVLEEYGWMPDSYTMADVRLQKRIYAKLLWEDSDILTKLVGMEFTQMKDSDLENDYAAIYYYYGYLGMGLYILFLIYFVIIVGVVLIKKWKYVFNEFNFTLFMVYVLQLGLAQFSGAILRRPNASIYLALVVALIFYQCQKAKTEGE